jgi:hypothetical protein
MIRFKALISGCYLFAVAGLQAHELQQHKLQVVLRDDRHLSLSLWLDIPKAMQQTIEPNLTPAAFEMKYSAMPLRLFEKSWGECISLWRQQWQLTDGFGLAVAYADWRWPDGAALQSQIKLQMMANITGSAHTHPVLTPVAGEAVSGASLRSARLNMPPSWQPLMVISYKPSQQWISSPDKSVILKF